MSENKYVVLFDRKVAAKDMDFEIAAILMQALSGRYYYEHHTIMVAKQEDYNNICSHNWVSYGATMITTKSPTTPIGCYEYLLCDKCGKHLLRPYISDAQGNILNK